MTELIAHGLATFYVALVLTTEPGPFGAFAKWREAVWRARGYAWLAATGDWRKPEPTDAAGASRMVGIEADWLAKGVACPVCAAPYVALLLLLAPSWAVLVLAAAGAAAALSIVAMR